MIRLPLRVALAAVLTSLAPTAAGTASLSKTYSYFSVNGTTLDQLEMELTTRGPQVSSTGRRHAGATQLEFNTRLGYAEKGGYCRVSEAQVSVKAKVILPRWGQRSRATQEVRTVWDTLSSDIKRHEEGHLVIARNYARELEEALRRLDRQRSCERVGQKAQETAARILEDHDREQVHFDRVEGINFEARMTRLLRYRMERMQGQ